MSEDNLDTAYIEDFDDDDWQLAFFKAGLAFVITFFLSSSILKTINYKLRLVPSWVATREWEWVGEGSKFPKFVFWVSGLVYLIVFLPYAFLIAWGILVYSTVNHLLGCALFLVGVSILLFCTTFLAFRAANWRLSNNHKAGFLLSVILVSLFQFWVAFSEEPYTYLGVSFTCVGFNMIFMSILVYTTANSSTLPVESFPLVLIQPPHNYSVFNEDEKEELARDIEVDDDSKLVSIDIHKDEEKDVGDSNNNVAPSNNEDPEESIDLDTNANANADTDADAPPPPPPPPPSPPVSKDQENDLESVEFQDIALDVIDDKKSSDSKSNVSTESKSSSSSSSSAAASDSKRRELTKAEAGMLPNDFVIGYKNTWLVLGLFILCNAFLLAYGIIVASTADNEDNKYVGYVTALAIFVVDIAIFMCVWARQIRSPLVTVLAQVCCRILCIVFGEDFWFIGHSMMYLILATIFGIYSINWIFPDAAEQAAKDSVTAAMIRQIEREEKLKSNPDTHEEATAGDAEEEEDLETPDFVRSVGCQSLLSMVHIVAFALLTLCFVFDTIWASENVSKQLEFHDSHDQYLAGIVIIFIVFSILCYYTMYRWYKLNDFALNQRILIGVLVTLGLDFAFGWVLWAMTDSGILLGLGICAPSMVISFYLGFDKWRSNDYQIYLSNGENCWKDKRALIYFSTFFFATCIWCLVIVLNSNYNRRWIGFAVSAGLLIITSLVLMVYEWFQRFQISRTMIVNGSMSLAMFATFLILMWTWQLESSNEHSYGDILLMVLFGVPCFTFFGMAMYKYRDDGGREKPMKLDVKILLCIAWVLANTALVIMTVFYTQWGGGGALVIFNLAIVLVITLPFYRYACNGWLVMGTVVGVFVLLLVFSLIVALTGEDRGFIGFSMFWLTCSVALLAACIYYYRPSENNTFIYSPTIFPVYERVPQMGVSNPLRKANYRVYVVLLLFAFAFTYGCASVFFIVKPYVGLGLCAFSANLIFIYLLEIGTKPQRLFSDAIRFVRQMDRNGITTTSRSDTFKSYYHEAITSAKAEAIKHQLGKGTIKLTRRVGKTSLFGGLLSAAANDLAGNEGLVHHSTTFFEGEEEKIPRNELVFHGLTHEARETLLMSTCHSAYQSCNYDDIHSQVDIPFRTKLPSLPPCLCGEFQPSDFTVKWYGRTLSMREAFELSLALDNEVGKLYLNYLLYLTHLSLEVLTYAEQEQQEYDLTMQRMLSERVYALQADIDAQQRVIDLYPKRIAMLLEDNIASTVESGSSDTKDNDGDAPQGDDEEKDEEKDDTKDDTKDDKNEETEDSNSDILFLLTESELALSAGELKWAVKDAEERLAELQVKQAGMQQGITLEGLKKMDRRSPQWKEFQRDLKEFLSREAEQQRTRELLEQAAAEEARKRQEDEIRRAQLERQRQDEIAAKALADALAKEAAENPELHEAIRKAEELKQQRLKLEAENKRKEEEWKLDELKRREAFAAELARLEEEARLQKEKDDEIQRQLEEQKKKDEEALRKIQEEQDRIAREEAEAERLAEEARKKAEAEAQKKNEEEEKREAEALAALEEARKANELAEEIKRLELEAQKIAEQARLKAEERKRKEEAERKAAEEETEKRRKAHEAELERLRIQREEQQRQERERARLEAERKAEKERRMEARRQQLLEQERKRKAEAEDKARREAEEQERLERERREAEQKAAEAAAELRRQRAAEQKSETSSQIAEAVKHNMCTYTQTGPNLVSQVWYKMNGAKGLRGCCQVCYERCHPLDRYEKGDPTESFYCDCGARGCYSTKESALLLRKKLADRKEHWIDPDFPPDETSLHRDPENPKHNIWTRFKWERPTEFRTYQNEKRKRGIRNREILKVFSARPEDDDDDGDIKGADPQDIQQGKIGDCWLMSALSVLTQKPVHLDDIFITKNYSETGVYEVKLWRNGAPTSVLVDDYFPTYNEVPTMGVSKDSTELWVLLIEKAFAKLNATYEAIERGFVDQALIDLTGGIGGRIKFKKSKALIRNGRLFKRLLNYHESGFLMGAGTPEGSDSIANASPFGLAQGHAYSLLRVAKVDDLELVQLRNPWGKFEWKGKFADTDQESWRNARLKAKLRYDPTAPENKDDGTFWMTFRDFTHHFADVYICRFFEEKDGWIHDHDKHIFTGSWRGELAGGCTNYATVPNNPHFRVVVTRPTKCVFSLSQTDTRITGQKPAAIGIEVYVNGGRKCTRDNPGKMVSSNPESYIYRREVVCEVTLQPNTYTILISTFKAGRETDWNFRVFSQHNPIEIELLG